MKRAIYVAFAGVMLCGSVGCMGPRVEVPTAHVGKVLTTSGFEKQIRQPSTFRLAWDPWGANPQWLVLVEASDEQKSEAMTVFMPKDRLNLTVDVRGTYSISNDDDKVAEIYARVSATDTGNMTSKIDFDDVYGTYGQQIVQTTCRGILVKYDIAYVMSHREELSAELEREVRKRMKGTPIEVVNFGLSTIQPPQLIIVAQKKAKEREVAIDTAKADRLVKLTEAGAALEVAKMQQLVDLLGADTQRQVALKLTKGVNPAFIKQRALAVLEKLVGNQDRVIVLPEAALTNPAIMNGVMQRAVSEPLEKKGPTSAPTTPAPTPKK